MSEPYIQPAIKLEANGKPVVPVLKMSLRDWFAGQALPGILTQEVNDSRARARKECSKESGILVRDAVAAMAYEYADAMIAAREAKS